MRYIHFFIAIIIVCFLSGCYTESANQCGNGIIDEGETKSNCCLDLGCFGEQTCKENVCVNPDCGECNYFDPSDFTCKEGCCNNQDCGWDLKCIDNKCSFYDCPYCQYPFDHGCLNYGCCDDGMCDDGDPETVDLCKFPQTPGARCIHIGSKCQSNNGYCPEGCYHAVDQDCGNECYDYKQCNDANPETKDSCVDGRCYNTKIVLPQNNNPIDNNQNNDECKRDIDCDDGEISTKDDCRGNPKRCYNEYIINDADEEEPDQEEIGDLIVSGDLYLGMILNGEINKPKCSGGSSLFFSLENTFDKPINDVKFDIYVDDVKVSTEEYSFVNLLRRYQGSFQHYYDINQGNNEVYVSFKKSVSNHKIKIVIDPDNEIVEGNENNNEITTQFDYDKMDLTIEDVYYTHETDRLIIVIRRDTIIDDCPYFKIEVNINGEMSEVYAMSGFYEGEYMTSAFVSNPPKGNVDVSIKVDSENIVEETNENNNRYTGTIMI